MGIKPVIIYNDCIAYKEDLEVNGSNNPFEYYFEQINGIENAEEYCNGQAAYLECLPAHYTQVYKLYGLKNVESYLLEEEHLAFYATIIKKYIHINEYTRKKMNKDMIALMGNTKYIAVHYRGSDFKKNYGNHPVSIGIEEYILKVSKVRKKYPSYNIFLATDDEDCVKKFTEEYGSIVRFYADTKRTEGLLSVMCSNDSREKHHYLLGYEVLRDMITLSNANVLIAGLSQVATFARIFKRSYGMKYEADYIMSKGINHNSRSHVTDMQKHRSK